MELALKPVKCSLDKLKLFERVDVKTIELVLKSSLLLDKPHKHIEKKFENEKQQIESYLDIIEKDASNPENRIGLAKVKYMKCEGYKYGRVYPVKSLSLGTIRRELRHTFSHEYKPEYYSQCDLDCKHPHLGPEMYIDIDVANCHPNIVYQMCEFNQIKTPKLKDYIENRFEHLQEIIKTYNVTRDQAKTLFIRLLYFGKFENWAKDTLKTKEVKPTKFIEEFIEERRIYGDAITRANEEIYIEVIKNKNKRHTKMWNEEATVVSLWCQEIECRILEQMYLYANKKGYIKGKICVLCYDGMMIQKEYYKYEILEEFTKLIKEKFNLNLKYETKEMSQYYTMPEILNIKKDDEEEEDEDEEDDEEEKVKDKEEKDDFKKSDREFFKKLQTMSDKDIAIIYHQFNPTKYIYSTILGWFEYDKNNCLLSYGDKNPSGMLMDISQQIEKHIIQIRNRMKPNQPSYIKDSKAINQMLKNVNSSTFIKKCICFLEELYTIKDIHKLIDANANLFAFSNKVFDYKELKVRDIKKDDYISLNTGYEYQKTNKKLRKEVRHIFETIFEEKEVREYFLINKGVSLFGNKFQSLFIQTGTGGNGKGTILSLEKNAFGSYYHTTETTFLTSAQKQGQANPTLASSRGKRQLIISEPEEDNEFGHQTSLNASFVKSISGGDPIKARTLYKEPIEFVPQFTPWIQCNDLPNIKKFDKGLQRRIKVIHHPLSFVDNPIDPNERKRDYKLKERVETSIELAREYMLLLIEYAILYKDKEIEMTDSIKQSTNKYFGDNNPVKNYIDAFIIRKCNAKVKTMDLLEHYNDNTEQPMFIKEFLKLMRTNGITDYLSMGYRYFKDIEIKEDEPKEPKKDEPLLKKKLI